ncbi:hypothetical protein L5515_019523 [Caenorhabditis briggsae]|uniref:Histone-lysine N-methyltransferase, H3 lysine-79 specific n=1 Tax=Caenorhabditis briggsae TaxID=6238 RepID=A0AAE9JTV7_CAEBR|nr:hypothetical protein L5515_019523 [Caenorhabditis briggsae]
MDFQTPWNLVDENLDIEDLEEFDVPTHGNQRQKQKRNGRKTARKVQKRSRKSGQQEVASKKTKKAEPVRQPEEKYEEEQDQEEHKPEAQNPVKQLQEEQDQEEQDQADVPGQVALPDGVFLYKVQSLYRHGVDLHVRSDEPNVMEVIEKIFTEFYKNVLPRLPLQQPDWKAMDTTDLMEFLESFNFAAEKFKKEAKGHLITELARKLSVVDERVLKRHYKSFSEETYGATKTEQMKHMLDQLKVKNDDVIFDLGSGIGQLVTFTASYANVAKVYGIEKCDAPADIAARISENFKRLMKFFGKIPSPFEFIKGDFTEPANKESIVKKATIIFANNWLFGNELMRDLREILHLCAPGTRVVVTKLIDQTRFNKKTYVGHFNSFSHTAPLDSIDCPMEWTDKKFDFWVSRMDNEKVYKLAEHFIAEEEEQEAKRETKRLAKAQKAELNSHKFS